jgi:hypothetical protein
LGPSRKYPNPVLSCREMWILYFWTMLANIIIQFMLGTCGLYFWTLL